ncbi:MAG: RNA-binding transcriptional accessory protein, partial [Methyloglobulus sp.]|nr:RNA-binding transcriptional accessory protein [Methyloglobulus sp.]
MDVIQRIAEELSVNAIQVKAAVMLLDEGATVPFIARYRKEATGGLDDTQLRNLEDRLGYLRELNDRRESILASIRSQDKLTPELEAAILAADTKTLLEDLYLPYKPKRRTKAQIAREAGLEPLADAILADRTVIPEQIAASYVNVELGVADVAAALEGARQIIMERLSEDAELLAELRETVWQKGLIHATVASGKEQEGIKFTDYFDYKEAINKIPSHRALAL